MQGGIIQPNLQGRRPSWLAAPKGCWESWFQKHGENWKLRWIAVTTANCTAEFKKHNWADAMGKWSKQKELNLLFFTFHFSPMPLIHGSWQQAKENKVCRASGLHYIIKCNRVGLKIKVNRTKIKRWRPEYFITFSKFIV